MRQLFTKTDKTLIPTLPRYVYEGTIHVIQSVAEAERAVRALKTAPLLGIDTETKPAFRRGEHHQVALLQVADGHTCFLFRLNRMGLPPCIARLLAAPKPLKVGLSLKDDFLMLRQRDKAFRPGGYIDLQDMVKEMGMEDMSLQKLYANVFRKRISKGARLTNWEADCLSEAQKQYAATDAVTCIQLYKELKRLRDSRDYELLPVPAEAPAAGQ